MTRSDDVHAIEQLLRTYAAFNDDGRWHELADLFTEDARLVRPTAPQQPIEGRDAILRSFLARPQGPRRRHLVADPEVQLLGPDAARARCCSVLLTDLGEGGGSVTVGGFDDLLARTSAGWRFCSRTGFTLFDPVPFTARSGVPWPAAPARSFRPATPELKELPWPRVNLLSPPGAATRCMRRSPPPPAHWAWPPRRRWLPPTS